MLEHYFIAPVAQLVEHLTFNQGVRSSILRRSTTTEEIQILGFYNRDVAQLVARLLWEQDVAGSNPVIPTIKNDSLDTMNYWCQDYFFMLFIGFKAKYRQQNDY